MHWRKAPSRLHESGSRLLSGDDEAPSEAEASAARVPVKSNGYFSPIFSVMMSCMAQARWSEMGACRNTNRPYREEKMSASWFTAEMSTDSERMQNTLTTYIDEAEVRVDVFSANQPSV
jgi:hypothetical protein